MCHVVTTVHAEPIEQDTERPTTPPLPSHGSVQDNSTGANTSENALRTSDTTDKPTENQEAKNRGAHAKPSGTQYSVLLSNIHPSLRHYTPKGPEFDLKWMLEDEYGPVLSVHIKRSSTPAGECLLGTAEVAFANQKTLQKCIRASSERFLFLFGRNLHARAI